MRTKRSLALHVALICSLCLARLLAPAPAMAWERKASTDHAKASLLASVLSLHRAGSPDSGPDVRVFGIGGGDPAMNGAFIHVCIEHNATAFVWETGLNVRTIQKVRSMPGNVILLDVREDFMDENMSIANRKATYRIRFHMDGDALQDNLTVETAKPAGRDPR